MKNKGTIIIFTAILALVSIYQLSFTFVTRNVESKAKAFATVDGVYDSDLYKRYIDSIGRQVVYNIGIASYTYNDCKQNELNLGLDLRGGMNVVLEISTEDIIKGLSGPNSGDKELNDALAKARTSAGQKEGDFIDFFAGHFQEIAPNRSLAPLFATRENSEYIKFSSTNKEVIEFLKQETKDASERAFEVIETRVAQSNVSQPNIQRLEGGRISVELPGVDNPSRIRRMLQESAALEFWDVYGNSKNNQYMGLSMLNDANKALQVKFGVITDKDTSDKAGVPAESGDLLPGGEDAQMEDATAQTKNADDASLGDLSASAKEDTSSTADSLNPADKFRKENPLFTYLYPAVSERGEPFEVGYVGYAKKEDIERVEELLNDPVVKKTWPSNVRLAWGAQPMGDNSSIYALYLLKANKAGTAILSGDIIVDARPVTNDKGQIEISMKMNEVGSKEWKLITKNASVNNDFIAVVLDGKVYTAPTVKSEIPNGLSVIQGRYELKEAQFLCNILKAGRLPAPARIVAEDIVGPTLGQESIRKGFISLILGFLSVFVIMFAYYSRGGLASSVAVLLNMFFIIGILSSYGAALTLPGIAGLILTIGMAVDANVLIFERIKEELLEGKAIKTAISNGYKAALSSILDANITTLLAGIIMTFAGAGPLYGFAIILIIGILSSLYTAILISRIIIENRVNKSGEYSFGYSYSNIGQNINFDFIGNRMKFYIISAVIIVAGVIAIASGGLTSGIDFKGGWSYTVELKDAAKSEAIKKILDDQLPGSSNEVKTIGSNNRFRIVTSYMIESSDREASQIVEEAVISALSPFQLSRDNILSSTKVGPTVASSTRSKSSYIVILAIVVIFAYIVIRFKNFSYGLGATVAIIHDVLVVFSIYALLGRFLPFRTEIDQTFIAAMLTIVGYSINDSVVVFDRIREFFTERRSTENVGAVINQAINKTLSRTLLTSSTTLFVVLILFIFGGEALKSFSFALLIGIAVGTYSSVFIAAPIVTDVLNRQKGKE
jgi:SecD/SecF fusion protein